MHKPTTTPSGKRSTSIPFFHSRRRTSPPDKRNRRYAALRYTSLRREDSSRLPLIAEDEPIAAAAATTMFPPPTLPVRSPQSPPTSSGVTSPTGGSRTPAHPFAPTSALAAALAMDRRHSSRRLRPRELSQLIANEQRGSFLSTGSYTLVAGVAGPRASKSSSLASSDKDANLASFLANKNDRGKTQRIWRKTKQWAQYMYEKSRLKYILPLLILLGYSFLGGAVIYWIEAPIERWQIEGKQKFLDDQKSTLSRTLWEVRENRSEMSKALMILRESVYWYTIATLYMEGNFTRLPPPTADVEAKVETLKTYTEQMARRCWEIKLEMTNQSDAHRKVHNSLQLFEDFTGVSTEVKPIWTFSNALFLAITIYTTIGYGSVAPHTVAGRVATIIYAIIGIPIYVMIIHKLGRSCLKLLHKFWKFFLRFTRYWRCRRKRKWKRQSSVNPEEDEESVNNIPVSLAVGVTFAWMLTCAGVCCLFIETSWDYFTSFYFFFISLTTIGLGDVTPSHPDYMFTMFGLIIVGLSLVSMCINVVQLKLELLFEEMMLALMEEYSGQMIDGELGVEPVDFQRGLGLSQMFKLWKKKRRSKKKNSNADESEGAATALGGVGASLLPLMARQRQMTMFREMQRRAREKSIGTQTDQRWTSDDPWRNWLEKDEATQTDWCSPKHSQSSSLVTCFTAEAEEESADEPFHSNLSLYSHLGCYRKHSAARPDSQQCCCSPTRPWSSMETSNRPSPQTPTTAGAAASSSTVRIFRSPSNLTPYTLIDNIPTPISNNNRYLHPACPKHGAGASTSQSRRFDYHYPFATRPASHSVSSGGPYYYRTSPSSFAQHPQIDHGRYWLAHFRPEAPPGGGVPAMAIQRHSREPSCDDFKSLIREIGCRLDECRHIVQQKESESDSTTTSSQK